MRPMTIAFPNGNWARAVYAPAGIDGTAIVEALGVRPPRAVLLLNGAASGMSSDEMAWLRHLLVEGAARVAAEEGITVIDGGTQAGVMQMMGEGRAAVGGSAPLIGVCPAALVSWPGGPTGEERVPLEPHHTHFALTAGHDWGAETATMFALAAFLSAHVPSVALLANGGAIARNETMHNVRQKREIIVLRGSGRLADVIAAAAAGEADPPDEEIAFVVRNGCVTLFNNTEGPEALAALIRRKLFEEQQPELIERSAR